MVNAAFGCSVNSRVVLNRGDTVHNNDALTLCFGLNFLDSITLWVSVNQTLAQASYRVFKNPASAHGDWKDVFSFNALLEPEGDFQQPVYVYSCPGSPYWRQYVSASPLPPKQNYKLCFGGKGCLLYTSPSPRDS